VLNLPHETALFMQRRLFAFMPIPKGATAYATPQKPFAMSYAGYKIKRQKKSVWVSELAFFQNGR
jgi:hypothetical protein